MLKLTFFSRKKSSKIDILFKLNNIKSSNFGFISDIVRYYINFDKK